MTAFKNGRVPLILDKTYYLLADLNAMEELQALYGELEELVNLLNGEKRWGVLRKTLHILLTEGAEAGEAVPSEKELGRLINLQNLDYVGKQVYAAFRTANMGDVPIEGLATEGSEKNVDMATAG